MSATRKTLNGTSLREGTTQKRELVSRTHLSSRPSISPTAAAQVHVNKHESHVKTAMLLLLFVRFCTSFTPSPLLPLPIPLVPVPRSGLPCSLPSSLLRSRPLNLILFFSCSERHQRWLRQLSPIGDTTAPGRSHFGRPGFLGWRNAKPFARPASSLGAAMVCAVNPPYPSLGSALLRSPSFSSPRPFDSPSLSLSSTLCTSQQRNSETAPSFFVPGYLLLGVGEGPRRTESQEHIHRVPGISTRTCKARHDEAGD